MFYVTDGEADSAEPFIAVLMPGTHGFSRLTVESLGYIQMIEWKTLNLTTLRRRCFAHAHGLSPLRTAIHDTDGNADALSTA